MKRMPLQIEQYDFKVTLYAPLRKGGPKSWAVNLARELKRNNIEATVKDNLISYLGELFNLSIVHSTVPFFIKPLSGKYILTVHGDFTEEINPWAKCYPLAIKQASLVTVPTRFLRDKLGLEDAFVVENGVERPRFIKNDFSIDNRPQIGMLTNFNFHKKAQGVVELAKIARETKFKGEILIGGKGKFFAEYQIKAKKIFSTISFLGFISKAEFFQKINIFTYFSLHDNQPIALIEAMAGGLPVVTNSIGATAEFVPEELLAWNISDYQDKLKTLVENQDSRIRNSEAGRKAASRFFVDKVAQRWISIYQNV